MIKVLTIGDLHLGHKLTGKNYLPPKLVKDVKKRGLEPALFSNPFTLALFRSLWWVKEQCLSNNPDYIVFLGDILEVKNKKLLPTIPELVTFKNIISEIAMFAKETFFITGNHDIVTLENELINILNLLFSDIATVITKPTNLRIDEHTFFSFLPYTEDPSIVDKFFRTTSRRPEQTLVFTHLDIHHLKKWSTSVKIFNGHIHERSKKEKITYCGSLLKTDFTLIKSPQQAIHLIELPSAKVTTIENPYDITFSTTVRKDCYLLALWAPQPEEELPENVIAWKAEEKVEKLEILLDPATEKLEKENFFKILRKFVEEEGLDWDFFLKKSKELEFLEGGKDGRK